MAANDTKSAFPPIRIGRLALANNLIAAPLAGLSTLPARRFMIAQGCALAISEMVSAEGALRAHERTHRYIENDERARPFGLQLFGAEPRSMHWATVLLENDPIDLVDINMGCPVKKVCSKAAGAALMRTPRRAAAIVRAVRQSTERPVTVKIRAGWDAESINCVEIARIAEAEGADAVVLHPRTREQFFSGRADWRHIAAVKQALSIPVIGNGDVRTRDDALAMLAETGCDGVMVGRAAVGNPWIFRALLTGEDAPPSPAERRDAILAHLAMLVEQVGERRALYMMRTALPWYVKGIPNVKRFLHEAQRITDAQLLRQTIAAFFDHRTNEPN